MADSPLLPGQHAWRLTPDGRLPPEFFKFFRDLISFVSQTQGNTSDLTSVNARLDALEAANSGTNIIGQHSIQAIQQEAQTIVRLFGDVGAPGATRYYGTDSTGARGWYERLLSTLADVDVSTPPTPGDALVFDGTNWAPAQVAPPQDYTRITAEGDVRITADGDIRITD